MEVWSCRNGIITFPDNAKRNILGHEASRIAKIIMHFNSDIVGAIVNNELKELWLRFHRTAACSLSIGQLCMEAGFTPEVWLFFLLLRQKKFLKIVGLQNILSASGLYCEVHMINPDG